MMSLALFSVSVQLVLGSISFGQEQTEPTFTADERRRADEATTLNREGVLLMRQGRPAQAVEKLRQSLALRESLYSPTKYPDGHDAIAVNLSNLSSALRSAGRANEALPFCQRSLDMTRKLYPRSKHPDGHLGIASGLNNLAGLLSAMGRAEEALSLNREALEMTSRLYPESKHPGGHPYLATSLNNVGGTLNSLGKMEEALPYYRRSLEMRKKLAADDSVENQSSLINAFDGMGLVLHSMGRSEEALPYFQKGLETAKKLFPSSEHPIGHPILARSLSNVGATLLAMGSYEESLSVLQQSKTMREAFYPSTRYPAGHPEINASLQNLGAVMKALGREEQSLDLYNQSLEMSKKLYPVSVYPDGHPSLAVSLDSVGGALYALNRPAQAIPFFEQSLAMRSKLYPESKHPNGHPDLAATLNNMGSALRAVDQSEKALTYYLRSLAMTRKLFSLERFPVRHPELVTTLESLSMLHLSMGRTKQAVDLQTEAHEICKGLYPASKYPVGHPSLAKALNGMANALMADGKAEQALPLHRESLTMLQQLLRRDLATASESSALERILTLNTYRDDFLTSSRLTSVSADEVYAAVWPSQSMVMRLLERRQADGRAARTGLAPKLDELRGLRRRAELLLRDQRLKPDTRESLLAQNADQRDRIERELIDSNSNSRRSRQEDLGPGDLLKALPEEAVFVDVVRYSEFREFVANNQGRSLHYTAFILAKGQPIKRLDLAEPKRVDTAVKQWREAIAARNEHGEAERDLTKLVWEPIAKSLSSAVKSIYLSLDGDLARAPWGALPIGDGRVLLEDYAVARVPHGAFLLSRLHSTATTSEKDHTLLAVGGLDYAPGKWSALPGSADEVGAVAAAAPGAQVVLRGKQATRDLASKSMAATKYAHFATHGFFDSEGLNAERSRAFKPRLGYHDANVTSKNPLGYVGLVLSNGEIFTGLSIVDLPLENLALLTLSACETGLGELVGGEGVQGLQRAFHLAGCPNVVASLWKVPDVPTLVLMEEFYGRLWRKENSLQPIEALREAQLAVMRNPKKVFERLGSMRAELAKRGVSEAELETRGFGRDLGKLPGRGTIDEAKRSPTQWWAGFVLSGAGR